MVFQPQPELRAGALSTTNFYFYYNLLSNYFLLHIPLLTYCIINILYAILFLLCNYSKYGSYTQVNTLPSGCSYMVPSGQVGMLGHGSYYVLVSAGTQHKQQQFISLQYHEYLLCYLCLG